MPRLVRHDPEQAAVAAQRPRCLCLVLALLAACDASKTRPQESSSAASAVTNAAPTTIASAATPPSSPAERAATPTVVPSPASAAASAGLPAVTFSAPREAPIPIDGDLRAWVRKRWQNAKAGKREMVRIPVTHRWGGSSTPAVFLGAWDNVLMGGDGLSIEWGPGTIKLTPSDYLHAPQNLVVEGWFTGEAVIQKQDLTYDPLVGDTFTFHATRSRVAAKVPHPVPRSPNSLLGALEVDAERVEVLLPPPESLREVSLLQDGLPWFAVVASLPLLDTDVDAHAAKTRADLVAMGFERAEIIDSRQATGLFCCYRVVLGGRFASEGEAQAAVAKAKKAFPMAYVRKGF